MPLPVSRDASEFSDLAANERHLTAPWDDALERAIADEMEARIFWLVTQRLEPQTTINGGWDQLFRDPRDGRYWELTFPQGSLHGGGPRKLSCITQQVAAAKYHLPSA